MGLCLKIRDSFEIYGEDGTVFVRMYKSTRVTEDVYRAINFGGNGHLPSGTCTTRCTYLAMGSNHLSSAKKESEGVFLVKQDI
jgi:hypothetical protein